MHIKIKFNEMFDFRNLDEKNIRKESETIIEETIIRLEKIKNIPAEQRNFNNTMLAIDTMYNNFGQVFSTIYLLAYVLENDNAREEAQKQIAILDKFANELSLDQELYTSVKNFANSHEAKSLEGYKKLFTVKTLKDFERNGFKLNNENREKLKELKNKLSELSIKFDTNIANSNEFLLFNEQEVIGLPDDFLELKKEKDKYKITLDYPTYRPFMKYAKNREARKKLQNIFLNRAADKNLDLLKQILILRKQMANLLGYKSYADYAIEDKMAKSTEKVWEFEKNLEKAVKEKAFRDLAELKQFHTEDTVQSYDAAYLTNLVLKEKYAVDSNLVKEYFSLENVIEGLFHISSQLYNIEFKSIDNTNAWHQEVKVYEIYQDGYLKGRFFFDLFPRAKKYNHAAMFPLVSGRNTEKGYQIPSAALITNFPRPTKDKPSLLPHNEVVTLFHEFGHLLHGLLTTAPLSSMAGTNVARDFVETPSQLMENWAWTYESVKLFAKHYKTGEILPKQLFDKIYAAKNLGSGLHILQQIFYGQLDLFYHDNYDAQKAQSTTEIVKELQNRITLYPYIENTHFEASFGHLIGYAAGYYGYLWSLVYSADIFSVFKENGVLNASLGKKLEEKILSKGSSKEEYQLLIDFLEREPDNKAFLQSIGL